MLSDRLRLRMSKEWVESARDVIAHVLDDHSLPKFDIQLQFLEEPCSLNV